MMKWRKMSNSGSAAALTGGMSAASSRRGSSWDFALTSGAIVLAVSAAWARRHDAVIKPEAGYGYALGIVGAVLMLLLILYPMRKRWSVMRTWGRAAGWFRVHMLLGMIGPTLIVMHSNFQLQSTNAAVAFTSMLTVAGSGLAGRFLYARIHRGLYGQKIEAEAMREEVTQARLGLRANEAATGWRADLVAFETAALAPTPSLGAAFARALWVGPASRRSRKSIAARLAQDLASEAYVRKSTDRQIAEAKRRADHTLRSYYAALRRAARLSVYDRLFALWHVLHVPLFILLVVTAVIHVVAVHLY